MSRARKSREPKTEARRNLCSESKLLPPPPTPQKRVLEQPIEMNMMDIEQLEIVPMQIRVIKHVRKVYACRGCETAPVTADKPAQLIEKSMASPSVLAMLLTTKYVDGLPLHRFEKVLGRHGIDIPRQTLARWVIQCGEHLQPLLNLMRDRLLESRVIHCDETRVQVLKEPDREPRSQS